MTWRQLWRAGAFLQRRLISGTSFAKGAKERGLGLAVGQRTLETLDVQGALHPIAFADGWNPHGYLDPTPFEDRMTFREDQPAREWSTYSWATKHARHTTALYSPWQLLYVDAVLADSGTKLAVNTLLLAPEERNEVLERMRPTLETLLARWRALDPAWRPLIKLLVRLQNRYFPEVIGSTMIAYDQGQNVRVNPWPEECERFDARAVASETGVSAEQVTEAYWFLVERGLDHEPRDGLGPLRRARPRSSQQEWRGGTRHAQDHYDAAQMLRYFLTDLTGNPPDGTPHWPVDGRQLERATVYDRGPVPITTREHLQEQLIETGLYPHAVHLVGEGKSEYAMVSRLLSGLVDPRSATELGFTDVQGVGSASHMPTLVGGFTTYAQRTVVIVDREGAMAESVEGLIRSGELPEEDVLKSQPNLEESNFLPAEMLDVLVGYAAKPAAGRSAVTLRLPLNVLLETHQDRCRRAQERPGLAGTLLDLAQDPRYGPITVSKPKFAEALADRMLDEYHSAPDGEALEALYRQRKVLRFVINRVAPILTEPSWRH